MWNDQSGVVYALLTTVDLTLAWQDQAGCIPVSFCLCFVQFSLCDFYSAVVLNSDADSLLKHSFRKSDVHICVGGMDGPNSRLSSMTSSPSHSRYV
jgi:hypothetical protein